MKIAEKQRWIQKLTQENEAINDILPRLDDLLSIITTNKSSYPGQKSLAKDLYENIENLKNQRAKNKEGLEKINRTE